MQSQITIEGQCYPFDLDMTRTKTYQFGPHSVELIPHPEFNTASVVMGNASKAKPASNLGEWLACSKTGELWVDDYYIKCEEAQVMKEQHVCFGTAFWVIRGKQYANDPLWFRIDGVSYYCRPSAVCTDRKPRASDNMRGFCGRTFNIQKGDEVLVIDDLWCNGDMPEWFKMDHPDNAVFISQGW